MKPDTAYSGASILRHILWNYGKGISLDGKSAFGGYDYIGYYPIKVTTVYSDNPDYVNQASLGYNAAVSYDAMINFDAIDPTISPIVKPGSAYSGLVKPAGIYMHPFIVDLYEYGNVLPLDGTIRYGGQIIFIDNPATPVTKLPKPTTISGGIFRPTSPYIVVTKAGSSFGSLSKGQTGYTVLAVPTAPYTKAAPAGTIYSIISKPVS